MFGGGGGAFINGAGTVSTAFRSIAFGATSDAVYLPVIFGGTGDIKLTQSWGALTTTTGILTDQLVRQRVLGALYRKCSRYHVGEGTVLFQIHRGYGRSRG